MRAVHYERYGPPEVLRVVDVEPPVPRDDEVLIRVHTTTVNRTDCGFRQGKPLVVRCFSGLRRPRRPVLGSELSGVVEAVGSEVTELEVGAEVFGVNADRFGAHAELVCVRQTAPLTRKPPAMSFEEAAATPDGFVLALTCLRWAGLRAGERILVYGTSGSIGTAGVQLARHQGADVTAVCDNRGLETVRSLGADPVIDYTQEDFLRPGETYDVIFDAVGKTSFGRCRTSLRRGGRFVATDFGPRGLNPPLALVTWLSSKVGAKQVLFPLPRYRKADILLLRGLLEAGSYRAVIDRRYRLEDVVEATRYVETEQKLGNVVLRVTGEDAGGQRRTSVAL